MDMEPLEGSLRESSWFPQYFMKAIFGCALAVTEYVFTGGIMVLSILKKIFGGFHLPHLLSL